MDMDMDMNIGVGVGGDASNAVGRISNQMNLERAAKWLGRLWPANRRLAREVSCPKCAVLQAAEMDEWRQLRNIFGLQKKVRRACELPDSSVVCEQLS